MQHSASLGFITGQQAIAAPINSVSHIAFTKAFPIPNRVSNKAKNPNAAIADIPQQPKQFLHILFTSLFFLFLEKS